LIGRDLDDNVVYYTECSGSDVGEILAILGVDGPEHNITEMARVFENDGMDLLTAVNVAALINAAAHR
jgi:hypothetical protein